MVSIDFLRCCMNKYRQAYWCINIEFICWCNWKYFLFVVLHSETHTVAQKITKVRQCNQAISSGYGSQSQWEDASHVGYTDS
jgi:hypothetical protein